jgi:hypothetical protein
MDKFDVLFIAMGVMAVAYLVAGMALEVRIARRNRKR